MWFLILMAIGQDAGAGQLSGFERKAPDIESSVGRNIWDIERCMIDAKDFPYPPPSVYAQPDRPDQVTLIWQFQGKALRRIDLTKSENGTRVKAWHPSPEARSCLRS